MLTQLLRIQLADDFAQIPRIAEDGAPQWRQRVVIESIYDMLVYSSCAAPVCAMTMGRNRKARNRKKVGGLISLSGIVFSAPLSQVSRRHRP